MEDLDMLEDEEESKDNEESQDKIEMIQPKGVQKPTGEEE